MYRTVTSAIGMASSQCQNHKAHDINSACKCVTVKVINPVAVTAVSSCKISVLITVYTLEKGYSPVKMAVRIFLSGVLRNPHVVSHVGGSRDRNHL
jgi:hypothetical protein